MGTLYRLISPSGKSYIGITSQTTAKRWWKHKNNATHGRGERVGSECAALYDAIRKYGSDNFKVETLVIAEFEYLKELERKVILAFGTKAPNGYNLTLGGEGALGASPTEAARKKMSAAQQKRLQDPEALRVIKEAIAKASAVKAAKWWALSEQERIAKRKEHEDKLSKADRFTPEVRAKMRAVQKARTHAKWSEERRLKVVESGSSKWSDEKKANAAEKRRQEWADPVLRQKRLDGFKRARETRQKETA
jgi:group I intron endonuclease